MPSSQPPQKIRWESSKMLTFWVRPGHSVNIRRDPRPCNAAAKSSGFSLIHRRSSVYSIQAPRIRIRDQNVDSNSFESPGRKLRRNHVPHDELFNRSTPALNSWKSFSSPSQNGCSVISPSIAPQCRQVSNVSPKAEAPETQHKALHPHQLVADTDWRELTRLPK